jgi:hypothetical protein
MSNGFATCKVVAAVERVFGVSFTGEYSKSRSLNRSNARAVAMYICRKHLNLSFKEIAEAFDKDYTSALNAVSKVEQCPDLTAAAAQAHLFYRVDTTEERPRVYATYVVEFEKRSPCVGAGTEILGGKLAAVQFDDALTQLDKLRDGAGELVEALDDYLDGEQLPDDVLSALKNLRDLT